MFRALAFLIIGLAFGGGLGFVLGSERGAAPAVSSGQAKDHADHDHSQMIRFAPGPDAPSVALTLVADPESGWNLNIRTRNFQFAADNAGQMHVDGEGHGHLYVNGMKMARIYGNWFHLGTLPTGEVEIRVTLNSNDHKSLFVGTTPVEAALLVNIAP